MKVSELQPGDIIWIYNSYEDYFAEFEIIQLNDDGSCRLHVTGETSIDEPDYGYSIDSLEFRVIKLSDCSERVKIFSTNKISYKFLQIKEYFKSLIKELFEEY